ncbi:30S ribosomal protein S6e [Candidatus Woesearchaeota archaeon]|nr:MAG: 30S ribosomal protein S6e [Candidatus Woesearchaeota archaeon]
MAELKLVLNDPKTGKSYQKTLEADAAKPFYGLKIGDTVKGEIIDLTGYEFKITGGSDNSGFPMRKDVEGPIKRKILAHEGVGIKPIRKQFNPKRKGHRRMKGMRLRKTVAGNTVYEKTAQLNMVITKAGKQPLDAPAEEPANETPAQEAQ